MNGTKIAVISDSHDNVKNFNRALDIANEKKCTHLFHLGDIVSPYTAGILKKFNGEIDAVFGNCDGDKIELKKVFTNIGGEIINPPMKKKINDLHFILMHEPILLEEISNSDSIDYIFYGHLHESRYLKEGKMEILNPGEAAGLIRPASFYVLDLDKREFEKIVL